MGLVQKYYKILIPGSTSLSTSDNWPKIDGSNTPDPEGEVLQNGSNKDKAKKVSISAPSGTNVLINNKTIVIGTSGIYDLTNEDIVVTSLKFPKQYQINDGEIDTTKKARLESCLNTVPELIRRIIPQNEDSIQDYAKFCDDMEVLYLAQQFHYTPTSGGDQITILGLSNLIKEYRITCTKTISQQQKELENIIVNYVTVN